MQLYIITCKDFVGKLWFTCQIYCLFVIYLMKFNYNIPYIDISSKLQLLMIVLLVVAFVAAIIIMISNQKPINEIIFQFPYVKQPLYIAVDPENEDSTQGLAINIQSPPNLSMSFIIQVNDGQNDLDSTITTVENALAKLQQASPNTTAEIIFVINSNRISFQRIIRNHLNRNFTVKILKRNQQSISTGAANIYGSLLAEGEVIIYVPVFSSITTDDVCLMYNQYNELSRLNPDLLLIANDSTFPRKRISMILGKVMSCNTGNPFLGFAAISRKKISHLVTGMKAPNDDEFMCELLMSCYMLDFQISSLRFNYTKIDNEFNSLLIILKYFFIYRLHIWDAVAEQKFEPNARLYE